MKIILECGVFGMSIIFFGECVQLNWVDLTKFSCDMKLKGIMLEFNFIERNFGILWKFYSSKMKVEIKFE